MDFYIDIFLSVLLLVHLAYGFSVMISNQNEARQHLIASHGRVLLARSFRFIVLTLGLGLAVDGLLAWRLFAVLGGQWSASIAVLFLLLSGVALVIHFKACVFKQINLSAHMNGVRHDHA